MAYSLTQVRTLLTAAELALFEHSRAASIKELTPSRLRAKITRARALRDKYRDLYRRQAVATSRASASRRAATGGDNARTEQKAQVFAEVLDRFEARLTVLDARAEREAGRSAARKVAKKAPAAKKATGQASVKAKDSGKAKPVKVNLKVAVQKALQQGQPGDAPGPSTARSAKAPAARSPRTPSGALSVNAPLDVTARAQRLNPLKERAGNLALHAHAGSQTRRAQGKRDSR